jgi:uncharacterized protein (TIGR02466 family)
MTAKKNQNQREIINLFPTIATATAWANPEKLLVGLEKELWMKRAKDPEGVYRSNAAGTWHSKDDVLLTTGVYGETLGKMFHAAFCAQAEQMNAPKGSEIKMRLAAWAMMYADRGYATVHTHPNCHFSSVFYLATGDGEEPAKTMATGIDVLPGTLEFVDTRGGIGSQKVANVNLQPAARINPRPGLMLTFPGWLPHFVHPVEGDKTRIAVACNATIVSITPPEKD